MRLVAGCALLAMPDPGGGGHRCVTAGRLLAARAWLVEHGLSSTGRYSDSLYRTPSAFRLAASAIAAMLPAPARRPERFGTRFESTPQRTSPVRRADQGAIDARPAFMARRAALEPRSNLAQSRPRPAAGPPCNLSAACADRSGTPGTRPPLSSRRG